MTSDLFTTALMGISFLLSLLVAGGLWWLTWRFPAARRFWGPLAAGETVALVASLGWGIYGVLGGEGQPAWTDLCYVARYLLVFAAFWFFPAAAAGRRWLELLVAMAAAALVLWFGYIRPAVSAGYLARADGLGLLLYPTLDIGILYTVWMRWRSPQGPPRGTMPWLALAALAYAIANWINSGAMLASLEAETALPDVFWFLSTVFTAVAVWVCRSCREGFPTAEQVG